MPQKINFLFNKKRVFHIFAYVPAGSIYEEDSKRGISHLLEHMVLKHTKDYTEKKLLEEITSLGGTYNAVTDRDVTFYYIMTHIDNHKKCMDIIQNVLLYPVFKPYELDMERKVVLEEISRRTDNDSDLYNLSYLTVLSPKNKYVKPVEGYERTLNKITVNDLQNYFNERYKDVTFVINCDERYKSEVERYAFSKFGPNKTMQFNDISTMYGTLEFTSALVVLNRGYQQYTTQLLFPSFPRGLVKENIVLSFVKYCLVSSGLYSILTYQLRSKRGLIYSVSSLNETYRYLGIMRIVIGTSDRNTDHICSLVFDILHKLKTKGLTQRMLNYFKRGFINEQKYALTSDDFKTVLHGESLFYDSDVSNEEYINLVKSIDNDDIKEVSRKVFDFNKIGILTYGNYPHQKSTEQKITDMLRTYIAIQ
jgi:zinc protease